MNAINWPVGHEPATAAVHEINRARSAASPEEVWEWLVRPDVWQSYYSNVRNVRPLAGPWPQINLGSRFSWVTFGVPVVTEVTEFEPYKRLAWTGTGRGSSGHHAWLLTPDATGTLIQTEETQRGLLSRLASPYLRRAMRREHQHWVDNLATKAASGRVASA